MIRKSISFLLCLILLYSCSNQEENPALLTEVPDSVIPKPTMIKILADLSLLESARSQNFLNKTDSMGRVILPDISAMQEEILKKYNLSKRQYESSFRFYTTHPEIIMGLYEEAMNELSQLQANTAR